MEMALREVAFPESLVDWILEKSEPPATVLGDLRQMGGRQVFYTLAGVVGDHTTSFQDPSPLYGRFIRCNPCHQARSLIVRHRAAPERRLKR